MNCLESVPSDAVEVVEKISNLNSAVTSENNPLNGEETHSPCSNSPQQTTSLSSSPVVENYSTEREKVGIPFIKVESGNDVEAEAEMESLSEGDPRLENDALDLDSTLTIQDMFSQEPLEIMCGDNNALMYLSKLCQGSKGPCILFHDEWITPNELQYISGRESAKDWKRSIRYKGKSLKTYIAHGLIKVHPPICDCQGCRISSPVNRVSLQNRGRLASKYNYQPTSPRQRKDSNKLWNLDSEHANRHGLPPLQMTLNPPTMVNGYGHSRYSDFGSTSECPDVSDVTPGPSPFSPEGNKRAESISPDNNRNSPAKRQRLNEPPASQAQVIQGSERFHFDVTRSHSMTSIDHGTPQVNGLGINRTPDSANRKTPPFTADKTPDMHNPNLPSMDRDVHSWSKHKPTDRPYATPGGARMIAPTPPPEQSIVVYAHDIPGPYYPGVGKPYNHMASHRQYPQSNPHAPRADPRTCCGSQSSGTPSVNSHVRDKVLMARFGPRPHSLGNNTARDHSAPHTGNASPINNNSEISESRESEIMGWSIDDVCKFIHTLTGSADYAGTFKEQEIDGQALLLLDEDHLTIKLGIKLGPALKIRAKLANMVHSKPTY